MVKKARFDVLVIGSPCFDLVFGGLPHWPVLGQELYVDGFAIGVGGLFNTAASLSRLGLRVALLCEIGNDFFSRYMLEEIDKAGVSRDLIMIRDYPWFDLSVCLPYNGERGFVSHSSKQVKEVSNAKEVLPAESSLKDDAAGETWVHEACSLLMDYDFDAVMMNPYPDNISLLDTVNRSGTTIFFDTGWDAQVLSHSLMPAIIKCGHFIMPNELEATFMTSTQTAKDAVRKLAEWTPTAIVKMGPEGAILCQQGQFMDCPAFPVKEVVDTTGAGDAFNAGIIYGVLKGYTIAETLRCGTICGSLSTTALTGTAAVPTIEKLEQLLRI